MQKALQIDAATRTIRAVEFEDAKDLADLVGGLFCTAWTWRNGDVLWVDDNGLLKASEHFFVLSLRADGQPLAGSGVITGREVDDNSPRGYHNEDPTITIEQVTPLITWMNRAEFDAWAASEADTPAVKINGVTVATYGQLADQMPRPESEGDETGPGETGA